MGLFLPENFGSPQQSSVDLGGAPAPESSQADIALMQRVLSTAANNPNLMPESFMAYMLDWIQTQRLSIPIGQVFGFSQYTARAAPVIDGVETTTSTTYVALTTAGPTLDAIGDGRYIVDFGCSAKVSGAGNAALMAVEANGVAIADDVLSCQSATVDGLSSVSRSYAVDLSNGGGNVLVAKYRSATGGVASFQRRWLTILKYGNL